MSIFCTDDGAELFFEFEGTERGKPPLIFIHGWCGNLRHWDHQVRYFRDSHRILRLDRRGNGRSTTTGSRHTAAQHAADIAALAQHVGISDALVIAHAGGGPIGVFFCAQFPALARAYIMIDSAIMTGFDIDHPTTRAGQFYADLMARLEGPDGDGYFCEAYTSYFGAHTEPGLVRAIVDEACRTPAQVRIDDMRLMAADTATPASSMAQPTLVIAGQWLADNSPAAVDAVRLKTYFKQLEFARAIGTGHFVHLEAPEQCNAFMQSFISRLA